MTIIELGRTTSITDRTTPDNQFVRRINLGPFDVDAGLLAEFPGLDESDRPTISVTGVRDQSGAIYTPKQSPDDVYVEPVSFHFDNTEQTLWIHLARTDSPFTTVLLYGLSQGFTDSRIIYIDNEEYLPLVEGSPALRQQQDIEGAGRLAFLTGSIRLSNVGGRLDTLIPAPVYGNDLLIYNLTDDGNRENYDRDELMQLANVFVEDYSLSNTEVDLRIQDRRKAQNIQIPTQRFSTADYPDIDSETAGTVIPVLWGQAREIPCIVTNTEVDTGNVTYRAAIELDSLGTVQVDTEAGWTTVTPTSVSLSTGEFELTAGDARDTNGNALDAKLVEPVGIPITHITDIIKDANDRFGNISETESNYDLDEWAAEESAISTGAYYIDDEIRLFDMILDLQNGSNVGWRYEIKPDGRRTFRVDDEARAPVAYIPNVLLRNRQDLAVSTDSDLLAAEIVATHSHSYVSGRNLRVIDDSERQNVLDIYAQAPRRTVPSGTDPVIISASAATEKATYIRERFSRIRGIVTLEIFCADLSRRDLLGLRIYDIIDVELTPAEFVDRDAGTITGREFYGIKRCKIISIDPNPRTAINTVEAVIIGDA